MTTAAELMEQFLARGRRYLWTDAFALCNLLALGKQAEALALIDRVHHELGRHRSDDLRRGWISGLSEPEGETHPTRGGLRIGKSLPERRSDEPFDEQLEWERDGQYFHYLTKWMHALDQAARATGDAKLTGWARELAVTAQQRFVVGRRMYWKMSIDLTRPVVAAMGHHDPLDGYVTCLQLGEHAAADTFRSMIDADALATTDALGIGGLFFDAYRLAQLDAPLHGAVLAAARMGLAGYLAQRELDRPAEHRLAFRELGLAIGLAAFEERRIHDQIVEFWTEPAHQRSASYRDHQDINDVMLATSLEPRGFLGRLTSGDTQGARV